MLWNDSECPDILLTLKKGKLWTRNSKELMVWNSRLEDYDPKKLKKRVDGV